MLSWRSALLHVLVVIALAGCAARLGAETATTQQSPNIQSLDEISIETLRNRTYSSELKLEKQLGNAHGGTEYSDAYAETGSGPYETYMASYLSDGLRVYTRIDLPNSPPPSDGYPIIIFCHGWVGIEAAPEFHFSYTPASMYAEMIDGYVDAGFVVLTPGYRGHGTVDGVAADGIEYMAAWDNATYLSPSFYAVDVLNLIEGTSSIESLNFEEFGGTGGPHGVGVDTDRIFLSSHSQGGDVALTVLAVAGEGSQVASKVAGASISDGTFAPRFKQLEIYSALQGTRRAFLSGDGNWNGTAVGRDGSINTEFVFGFPPDWIVNPQPDEWTWQNKNWPDVPVDSVVQMRTEEMYSALSKQVAALKGVSFKRATEGADGLTIEHDPRVVRAMEAIGGYNRPQFLSERMMLHFSDQDFYSPPSWNIELCSAVNEAGGRCAEFLYKNNSHLMRASEYEWFSPADTKDSYRTILARDIRFFLGLDPAEIVYP